MEEKLKNVLVVDDDPRLLDIMESTLLQDSGGMGVFTASSGTQALDILASEEIVLVVTDINMPGITGLQLLSEIREHYPDIKVIIITGFGTPEIRSSAEKNGCLKFIDKPFDCQALKTIIQEQLENQESGFAGTLKQIHLIDLIQMCCQAGMSMAVKVKKGKAKGTIMIESGKIIHAVADDLTGEPAFYEILSWPNGSFETLGSVYVKAPTIDKSSQYLLMEAARIADEKQGDASDFNEFPEDDDDEDFTFDKNSPIQVLIVDDSSMMCRVIEDILTKDDRINVVGKAKNGKDALEQIDTLQPDLITLDVNMPVMDGSTALKHIMIKSPCPVVIISNVSSKSHLTILDFLRLGAVDFIQKPGKQQGGELPSGIVDQVKLAATANTGNLKRLKSLKPVEGTNKQLTNRHAARSLVLMYSGSGGYPDLIRILTLIPDSLSTCVIAFQGMPADFLNPLSGYLDERCYPPVLPASRGAELLEGVCYIGTDTGSLTLGTGAGPEAPVTLETFPEGRTSGDVLISASEMYSDRLMVVLLSGACQCSSDSLKTAGGNGASIVVQTLQTAMVKAPLEDVVSDNFSHQQADADDIARLITEWKNS